MLHFVVQAFSTPEPTRLSTKPEILDNAGLLLASCVGVIFSCIVLPFYTLGIFVVPVTEAFGWSRSEFQLSLLFSTGIGVFTAPVVGAWWHMARPSASPTSWIRAARSHNKLKPLLSLKSMQTLKEETHLEKARKCLTFCH